MKKISYKKERYTTKTSNKKKKTVYTKHTIGLWICCKMSKTGTTPTWQH